MARRFIDARAITPLTNSTRCLMSTKIEVNSSPSLLAGSQAILAKMKILEERYRNEMTTFRLDDRTMVSCRDKKKIEEYKKSLNIKC